MLKIFSTFFNTFQRSGLKSRILTGIDNGDEAGLLLPGRGGSSASGTPIVTGCESDQVALGYQKPNFQHFSTKKSSDKKLKLVKSKKQKNCLGVLRIRRMRIFSFFNIFSQIVASP